MSDAPEERPAPEAVPPLEVHLADPVAAFLRTRGYDPFHEVYFNGRIADLLAVRDGELVAVELKLRDYKAAHRQAMAYQVGCHLSYVALPLPTARLCLRKHRGAFEDSGVGLLAVHAGEVREALVARHHEKRFLPFLADGLLASFAHVRRRADG